MVAKQLNLRKFGFYLGLAFILAGLLAMPGFALSTDQAPDLNSMFHDANQLYQKGDYAQAVEVYRQLSDSGYVSGNLYYNLGNSYSKLAQPGWAILYYEKAKRLIPWDANLRANLSSVLEGTDEGQINWRLDFGNSLALLIPMYLLLVFSVVLLIALCSLITCLLLLSKEKTRNKDNGKLSFAWKLPVIGCGCLLGICLLLTAYSYFYQAQPQAVIIKTGATAHMEPNAGSDSFRLSEGTRLFWQESNGDWCLVKRKDGKRGWVEQSFLQQI